MHSSFLLLTKLIPPYITQARLFGGRQNAFGGKYLTGTTGQPLQVIQPGNKLYILCHGTEERPSRFMTNVASGICKGETPADDVYGVAEMSGRSCNYYYSADAMADLLIAAGLGLGQTDMVYDIELLSCGSGGVYPAADCSTNCETTDRLCLNACEDFVNYVPDDSGGPLPLGQLLGQSLSIKASSTCSKVLISAFSRSVNDGVQANGLTYGMSAQGSNLPMSGVEAFEVEPIGIKHRNMWGMLATVEGRTHWNPYYWHFNNSCK